MICCVEEGMVMRMSRYYINLNAIFVKFGFDPSCFSQLANFAQNVPYKLMNNSLHIELVVNIPVSDILCGQPIW